MTILSYVERPGFSLRVCGTPSAAWFEWLETANVHHPEQLMWKKIHTRNATPTTAPPRTTPKQFDLEDTNEL